MDCDNFFNVEADAKPFSIRQFVAATRRKDIFQCWPFQQKYLKICLKYGISNVLPSLEPLTAATRTTAENIGLTWSQQDQENVFLENNVEGKLIKEVHYNSYYNATGSDEYCLFDNSCKHKDESNFTSDYSSNVIVLLKQQSSSTQGSNLNICSRMSTVSPKGLRHKKRKHEGRQKKLSMVDILARAKPCTLDGLYKNICK